MLFACSDPFDRQRFWQLFVTVQRAVLLLEFCSHFDYLVSLTTSANLSGFDCRRVLKRQQS